jgi:pilus assembly protein CpaB
MRPARILLLLVALIAGGLAAYLATRGSGTPAPVVVQQAAAPKAAPAARVLVAKAPIGVGQRLTADLVDWQPWPGDAVRPEYITSEKSPDAPKEIAGTVARFEIFVGEPILDSKLVHSNQGVLSAVLDPGMRGVSIPVTAASGSGGFIIPNDRVDVVVTNGSGTTAVSQVVLSDVKVLAIGARLGQIGKTGSPGQQGGDGTQDNSSSDGGGNPRVFSNSIATLELTPPQADTLINASATGRISLVLRSVADFNKGGESGPASDQNQTVKLVRFGRAQNVMTGAADQPQATIAPAAYAPPDDATAPAQESPPAEDSEPVGQPVTNAAGLVTTIAPADTNP